MKRLMIYISIALTFLCANATHAQALKKVKIELKWFHQFQFAGIYAAKEQGYYKEAGLDVEIIERDIKSTPLNDVLSNKVQFGISDATLILNRLQGKPVIVLAAIYQHSPLALISLAKNKILGPQELKNKRVMYQVGVDDAIIVSMFNELGMTKNDFTAIPSNFKTDALLTDNVDAMAVYLGNQTFYYQNKKLPITILSPRNYGIDLYGDMIFTSEKFFNENQQAALAFRKASIKGWQYALNNIDKTVELIFNKYSKKKSKKALLHEASYTKRMMSSGLIEVGHLNMNRFNRIELIYKHWHPNLVGNTLKGLSYKEHLSIPTSDLLTVGLMLIGASVVILLISLWFVFMSRRKRKIADLAERKATEKLDSYKKIILEELITVRTDTDGTIDFVSDAFLNVMGLNLDNVLNKKISDLYAMDVSLANIFSKNIQEQVLQKGIWRGELALKSGLGLTRFFDCIVDDISDDEGRSLGYLTIHFDVTDKKHVEKVSITDELTGLYNRYKLNESLEKNIQDCNRFDQSFSVALLDADHFKQVNDVHGHNQGDIVLQKIGEVIKQSIRIVDVAGRWGGEEFLVICPNTSEEGAMIVAEKIRCALMKIQFKDMDRSITLSAGIAVFCKGDVAQSLLERADDALYEAKSKGRNQVVFL